MSSWAAYVLTVSHIVNVIKHSDSLNETSPEFVTNRTENDLLFCVELENVDLLEIVRLKPGESMVDIMKQNPEQKIKDVEAIIDDSGEVTKLTGVAHSIFQEENWVTDALCEYYVKHRDPGIDDNCRIVDPKAFLSTNRGKRWEKCIPLHNDKPIQTQPGTGGHGFDRAKKEDMDTGGGGDTDGGPVGGTDLNSLIKPIELEGGLFQVGYASLTHRLLSPNFEGVSPHGWVYPIGHYNRLGYDNIPDAYYGNHIMDCHKIPDTGIEPHGIYQDLFRHVRIKGKIRFGVHAKRTSGPDDAEINIAIWSVNKHENSHIKYRMPLGIWCDCFADAEVDFEDNLRVEIYLPEGATYHLGGAYIISQIV